MHIVGPGSDASIGGSDYQMARGLQEPHQVRGTGAIIEIDP
jgi:hypothetical protein